MKLRKYRWSRDYESAEEELVRMLAHKNITAERWIAEEYEVFSPHKHPLDKQLWCVEGSIEFIIAGKPIWLQAGDAFDLPAGTVHEAKAGFSGVVCYESPILSANPTIEE